MKEASSVPCQGCGVFVRQDRLLHKCYNTMTAALLPWTAAKACKHHSQVQPSPLIAVFNSLKIKNPATHLVRQYIGWLPR